MKIYIISVNGQVEDKCFTALKGACIHAGVKFSSAYNYKKRKFIKDGRFIVITAAELIKIEGRNFKK